MPYLSKLRCGLSVFLQQEKGQDLAEYAVLLALIVILYGAAYALVGDQVSATLSGVGSTLTSMVTLP